MAQKIRIGSRGSDLALWQANFVKNQLKSLGKEAEIKIIKTKGDQIQHLSFDKIEGKGFFTKEIEQALLDKSIDLAVHSHKDLETNSPEGLEIVAVSQREDPSELLLINKTAVDQTKFWQLKQNAVIGTSSARRKAQLLFFREDLKIKDLRGNVPTRIDKLREGNYDAILIANAGVSRLDLDVSDLHAVKLPIKWFVPAPAQGVLGIQIRENDTTLRELLIKINSTQTQEEISIERKVLNLMNGGCQLPLGVYCEKVNQKTKVWTSIVKPNEKSIFRFYKENATPQDLVDCINTTLQKEKKVFISRDLMLDSLFSKSLKEHKINIIGKSLIEVNFLKMNSLPVSDWVFFNSTNAVLSIAKGHKEEILKRKLATIGTSTALALQKLGYEVDFIGNGSPEKVSFDFLKTIDNASVFFPVSDRSLRTVQSKINSKQIIEQITYTINEKKLTIPTVDLLVFTSPSNVHSFYASNKLVKDQKVIAIGPSTKKVLLDYGIKDVDVSWESSELSLSDEVIAVFYSN